MAPFPRTRLVASILIVNDLVVFAPLFFIENHAVERGGEIENVIYFYLRDLSSSGSNQRGLCAQAARADQLLIHQQFFFFSFLFFL